MLIQSGPGSYLPTMVETSAAWHKRLQSNQVTGPRLAKAANLFSWPCQLEWRSKPSAPNPRAVNHLRVMAWSGTEHGPLPVSSEVCTLQKLYKVRKG